MSEGESIALHEEHCIRAFEGLERFRIHLKLEKCSFSQRMVKRLGVLCGQKQKVPDKTKVDMFKNWPFPSTLDDLASVRAFAAWAKDLIGPIYHDLDGLLKPYGKKGACYD